MSFYATAALARHQKRPLGAAIGRTLLRATLLSELRKKLSLAPTGLCPKPVAIVDEVEETQLRVTAHAC